VTVLFCDVTGSTALGESTDPEAVRVLLARYFERMKGIVESHGGTVDKFIGDAVMAVFGVPQVHEDDALRAVRAACEMREALPELNVQARIGLNTGEVVTGTEERLVTGDAVNVAKRLEQAAAEGEILIGEATLALVHGAVEAEALAPLKLKGKEQPVPAYRLVSVQEAPERRHESRFVGRVWELERLREAWQQVCAGRRCELVTVVGEAGVGKSRLAAEFLAAIDAQVVSGRCLPYGDGITYWPVVEVIKQLDSLPSDPAAAAAVRSLLRETEEPTSAEEIAWAFRKLLEQQAPLVCLFDDIQWGEETFLDLIEHVALLSSGAPILLLCLARPDLVERRAEWPVALRLEPLPETDVDALIPELLVKEARDKIRRACGGNPLFVIEMVMLAAEAEGEVVVPQTLRAVLAARLDQLEPAERFVLERAAVEGEIFQHGAVRALSDGREVTPHLASLVRKGLIRPDKAQLPGEDAFRFRHLLLRDAAYEALPKATRAALHERFATWLLQRGEGLVEQEEILGYHLEQAVRYRAELGQPEPRLAARAGEHLAAAGRRALWRGDIRAGRVLLERALTLTRPLRLDIGLELDLADTYSFETAQAAAEIAEAAAERAREAGDEVGEAAARVMAAHCRLPLEVSRVDELESLTRAALPLLERAHDHAGLVHVWGALGQVANVRCRYEEWWEAWEQANRHARLARQPGTRPLGLELALVYGPRPADEALRALDAALPDDRRPWTSLNRAVLLAMLARFEEARPLADEASERVRELTGVGVGDWLLADIATLAGDHHTAARYLRRFCDLLEQRRLPGYLSTHASVLGRSLCALGRYEEAEPLAELSRERGSEEDVATQALWRQVQARVRAHRGEHAEAERLAREAVEIAERTDGLNNQGDALCDLAEVLAAAGRGGEAAEVLAQALERYERKKNLAMVAQVRAKLEELRKAAPA
jgi:class 3 adenylate cyclase/tetratricopeptide (TPR) repeat protein